jgi:hypothetical protein
VVGVSLSDQDLRQEGDVEVCDFCGFPIEYEEDGEVAKCAALDDGRCAP